MKRYDSPKYKPDSKVCGSLRQRLHKQASYYCPKCNTLLCIVPGDEIFHNYKDLEMGLGRASKPSIAF